MPLAREQFADGHRFRHPGTSEDDLARIDLAGGHPSLERRAFEPHLIGPPQRSHVLRSMSNRCRLSVHFNPPVIDVEWKATPPANSGL